MDERGKKRERGGGGGQTLDISLPFPLSFVQCLFPFVPDPRRRLLSPLSHPGMTFDDVCQKGSPFFELTNPAPGVRPRRGGKRLKSEAARTLLLPLPVSVKSLEPHAGRLPKRGGGGGHFFRSPSQIVHQALKPEGIEVNGSDGGAVAWG